MKQPQSSAVGVKVGPERPAESDGAPGAGRLREPPRATVLASPPGERAREVMGDTMHASLFRYKIDAWTRYHQTVTDWEVEECLRLS